MGVPSRTEPIEPYFYGETGELWGYFYSTEVGPDAAPSIIRSPGGSLAESGDDSIETIERKS